ncbi:MAG: GNAT family N-acetyltransferase [Anaerolineales bacterium]|jgi:GNAT superfamily N-acetyltransferase
MMEIRKMQAGDWPEVWAVLEPTLRAGRTYAFDPAIDQAEAHRYWVEIPVATFVAVVDGEILGTYYIKPNQPGQGSHVCNCGYVVALKARGQGIASAMCKHSLGIARELGFRAMQYNLVVATNTVAVSLWQKHGFRIVGTLPGAFRHPEFGFVDAHVMYRSLM